MTRKTILIVDDDPQIVEVIAKRCRSIGLKVLVAHNALSALLLIDKRLPDLVCLDVELPTGNGLDICEIMATSQETHNIPVIVLTGRRDAETIRTCRNLRAYYVPKSAPLWQQLEPLIYELIGKKPPKIPSPRRRTKQQK